MGVETAEGSLTRRVPEKMVSVVVAPAAHGASPPVIDVRLLGRFVVTAGGPEHSLVAPPERPAPVPARARQPRAQGQPRIGVRVAVPFAPA